MFSHLQLVTHIVLWLESTVSRDCCALLAGHHLGAQSAAQSSGAGAAEPLLRGGAHQTAPARHSGA